MVAGVKGVIRKTNSRSLFMTFPFAFPMPTMNPDTSAAYQ